MASKRYVTADGVILKPIPQREETGPALLRAIWEEIKDDQSAWNQGLWVGSAADHEGPFDPAVIDFMRDNRQLPWDCGTACCLAGHAVMAKGYQFAHPQYSDFDPVEEGEAIDYVMAPGATEGQYIPNAAMGLLEISRRQKYYLFSGDRRPYEIQKCVEALEADPRAELQQVLVDVDPDEARRWERANGFRDEDMYPTYGTLTDGYLDDDQRYYDECFYYTESTGGQMIDDGYETD